MKKGKRKYSRHLKKYASLSGSEEHVFTEKEQMIATTLTGLLSLMVASFFKKPMYVGLPLLAAGIYTKKPHAALAGVIMGTYDLWLGIANRARTEQPPPAKISKE